MEKITEEREGVGGEEVLSLFSHASKEKEWKERWMVEEEKGKKGKDIGITMREGG